MQTRLDTTGNRRVDKLRIFSIQPDDTFAEYNQIPFQVDHEERVLEDWFEDNSDGILEDSDILIIGRQVSTDLGKKIDLLGLDRDGNVVVVELKRDRTPRDTIAQSLEYASFVERLDIGQLEEVLRSYTSDEVLGLAELHREYFRLDTSDAVAFNKDQRIVVVGQHITSEIKRTASFLRTKGIRITCVEFTFFQADGGNRLLSQEVVVGKEADKPVRAASASRPQTTEDEFLASLDENGRAVVSRILEWAGEKSVCVRWRSKGFSLNAECDGNLVGFLAVSDAGAYTLLRDAKYMRKTAVPEDVIQTLWRQAESTGLFVQAGKKLRCQINRKLTDTEVDSLLNWCESVEKAIQEYGLKP